MFAFVRTGVQPLQPGVQAVVQPAVQPVAQPVVQPVAQSVVQPAAQPVVQPVAQPVVQPVVQPVAQPVVQPVVQPAVQPVVQPVAQPVVQPPPCAQTCVPPPVLPPPLKLELKKVMKRNVEGLKLNLGTAADPVQEPWKKSDEYKKLRKALYRYQYALAGSILVFVMLMFILASFLVSDTFNTCPKPIDVKAFRNHVKESRQQEEEALEAKMHKLEARFEARQELGCISAKRIVCASMLDYISTEKVVCENMYLPSAQQGSAEQTTAEPETSCGNFPVTMMEDNDDDSEDDSSGAVNTRMTNVNGVTALCFVVWVMNWFR